MARITIILQLNCYSVNYLSVIPPLTRSQVDDDEEISVAYYGKFLVATL